MVRTYFSDMLTHTLFVVFYTFHQILALIRSGLLTTYPLECAPEIFYTTAAKAA